VVLNQFLLQRFKKETQVKKEDKGKEDQQKQG
jgi:hypothetical protein